MGRSDGEGDGAAAGSVGNMETGEVGEKSWELASAKHRFTESQNF